MPEEVAAREDAPWKQRFRAPTILWSQQAKLAPQRGLVATNASGVVQLYSWDVPTGTLTRITSRPEGKGWGRLSPDGAYVFYHDDELGNEIGHWVRVPFTGGTPEDVTPELPPYASWGFGVSAAGNRVGFTSATEDGFHTYVVDIGAGGELSPPRQIHHGTSLTFEPQMSYGGEIGVVASGHRSIRPLFSLLAFDLESGEQLGELWDGPETNIQMTGFSSVEGDPRLLAATDRTGVKRPLLWNPRTGERTDMPLPDIEGDVEPLDWSSDGRWILLSNAHRAMQQLYLYDLWHGTTTRLAHPGGTYGSASFTPEGEIFAQWQDSTNPGRIIALDPRSGARTRTVLSAGEVPPGRAWQRVDFPSGDGTRIVGWLATPERTGPVPTILHMIGGPGGVMMDSFDAGSQAWLDHGYAFLTINYRGCGTFGKAFEEQIWGDLGHWEVEDMVAARNWLVEQGIADPEQILLTGWSFGGYLTLMGLGKRPDLWAGGIAGIAIADWAIQYEDTADTLKAFQVAILGGTPDEKPEVYARCSPITYANQVAAPVLVIQGRSDTRCPARPMEMYERKMRSLGNDIEVVWFESGHGSLLVDQEIEHQELMLRFASRVLG
jgi:dienelactone hydrolase